MTPNEPTTIMAIRGNHRHQNDDNDDVATILDDGLSTCDDNDDDDNHRRGRHILTSTSSSTSDALVARQSVEMKRYRCITRSLFLATILVSVILLLVLRVNDYFPSSEKQNSSSRLDNDDDEYGNGLSKIENEWRLNQTLEYLIRTGAVADTKNLLTTIIEDTNNNNNNNNNNTSSIGDDNDHDDVVVVVASPQFIAAVWIAQHDKLVIPIPSLSSSTSTNNNNNNNYNSNNSSSSQHHYNSIEYQFLQRYSLAVLFIATGGIHTTSSWTYPLNFLQGVHECEGWYDVFMMDDDDGSLDDSMDFFPFGVICDGMPDYDDDDDNDKTVKNQEDSEEDGTKTVTAILLPPMNNLWGSLPPELHHLRYLKTLFISENEMLTGEIPFQYGWLKNLDVLVLTKNNLSGKIPHSFSFLTKLRALRLEVNRFSGDTVQGDFDFLKEMTSLEDLALDYNTNITGTLPEFVSNLSQLKALSLSNTKIYGTLPSTLSQLTELQALFVDDCDFTGSVGVLQTMSNLTHVYLEDNSFNDTIDDTFFAACTNLLHLDVSNCSFVGTVPGHLFNNLSHLEVLDMSLNYLDGNLPVEALARIEEGNNTNLTFLSLHTNNLSGVLPPDIRRLHKLTVLDLSSNQFSGSIPSEVGSMENLEILFLGRNNFTNTTVPTWLRNMTSLTELSLARTSLTGNIPSWIGELAQLLFLDLGENELMGTIPQSLEYLADLMVLILKSNNLEGELGLGKLAKLEVLLIDDNNLRGNTDAMCSHEILYFVADCGGSRNIDGMDVEIECSCCTLCCLDSNITCNDSEWLGNHEGIWETGYSRVNWQFEDAAVSPYVNYNYFQYVGEGGV